MLYSGLVININFKVKFSVNYIIIINYNNNLFVKMKLLQIVLLLGVAAPTQIAQKSTSSIQEKLEQVDFTIETATVDNPVAYESGLYRHHA